MRLEPVPSGQLLPAVLGKVRELQSLAVELSRSAQIESEAMCRERKEAACRRCWARLANGSPMGS
jgi:hypothetical protein